MRHVPDMLHGGGWMCQLTAWRNVHKRQGNGLQRQGVAGHITIKRCSPSKGFAPRKVPGEEEVAQREGVSLQMRTTQQS